VHRLVWCGSVHVGASVSSLADFYVTLSLYRQISRDD